MLKDIGLDVQKQVISKLKEDGLGMCWYFKQTDLDSNQNDKELFKAMIHSNDYFLRRKDETKTKFDFRGCGHWQLDGLASSRQKGIQARFLIVKSLYKKIKKQKFTDEEWNILSRYFAGISFYTTRRLFFIDCIKRECWIKYRCDLYSVDGFYYNERFGENALYFFGTGFFTTYVKKCNYCGVSYITAYEDNSQLTEVDGHLFCDNCLRAKNYGKCDYSQKMGFRRKLTFSCDQDKAEVLKRLKIKQDLPEYNVIVREVNAKGVFVCSHCNNFYVRKSGEYYCSDCMLGQIQDYSVKNYHFCRCKNEEENKEFFGFELETEVSGDIRECAKVVNKGLKDLVVLKRDGSLDDGFEIVSHTLTYKKYMNERKRFDKALKDAVKEGCFSQNARTTGLHIHLSRSGFDNWEHLARFCQTWYMFKDLTKYIAQRDFGRYREWDDYISGDTSYFKKFLNGNLFRTHDRDHRYRIVNLNNSNTVEIRIFKGILSEKYLSICIEICKLVKEYSRNQTDSSTLLPFLFKMGSKRVKNFLKLFEYQHKYGIQEA